jgi:hypothetical protein
MAVHQLEDSPNGVADVVDAPKLDKGSWLGGATDLEETEVWVDAIGDAVKVRALSAGQQAAIQDQSLSMKGDTVKVDSQRMQVLKFAAGVIEPKFNENEANQISHRFGKAFSLVVGVIDELSKAGENEIRAAQARFRPSR